MLRRWFLGSAIAAAALMAGPSAKAADALLFEQGEKSVLVRGNPDDVVAFMYRYQDALWADWRSHERTAASYVKHEQRVRKSGVVEVYTGCNVTRKAFAEAIR